MDNFSIKFNGRPYPRSQAEMEKELADLKSRGVDHVQFGRAKNIHERTPFAHFLLENNIRVTINTELDD